MDVNQLIWFYYDKGFSIIPLGNNIGFWKNKENEPKKPSIQSWDQYKTTPATREEIQQWIDDKLFTNIGVICGHVSNDIVIIDIDDETIPELIGLKFDKIIESGAWVVQTGRGYQIYMRHHGNPGGIKKPLKYKIEFRANNGYCVAPPSIHPNGKTYKFLEINDFHELPDLEKKDVKSIFEEFKKQIAEKWGIKEKKHGYSGTINQQKNNGNPKCVEIALNNIVKHPMRYNTIYGIASSFSLQHVPKDMAMKRIKQFNMEKCIPPKSTSDIENAVNGAYDENSKKYGCEFWMDDAELCPYENIMECPYGAKKAKRELAKQYHIFEYKETTKQDTNEKIFVKTNVRPPNLAELLLNEYDFNFATMRDNKEMFYYNDGLYHPDAYTIIRSLSEEYMEKLTKTHHKNEIEDYIRDKNYQDRLDFFKTPPELINVQNGILNITTNKLTFHSPKHHFINEIPVKYDSKAKCPQIMKFIKEVLYKDDISTLQEFMGYCLYRRYHIHKACMFLGEGKNGKSTMINLMTAFLGEKNVSNKELQELIYQRFSTSKLYGKLLNAAADISDSALKKTGKFKELTGEDRIDAEEKFKGSFSFVNYAKFMFSANKLPPADDDSYAFFRRWILISFPNTFIGKQCDENLINKLTTPEELSGFLNWCLIGLQRLLKTGDFSFNKTVEEVAEQYKTLSDPEYAFVKKYLEPKTGTYLFKDDVYKKYVEWGKENKLPITPKNILTQKLTIHLPELKAGRHKQNGVQITSYDNVTWKSDEIDEPCNPSQQKEII